MIRNQNGNGPDIHSVSSANSKNGEFSNGTLTLYLQSGQHGSEDLQKIRAILCQHPGEVSVQLHIQMDDGNEVKMNMGSQFSVLNSLELREKLGNWIRD